MQRTIPRAVLLAALIPCWPVTQQESPPSEPVSSAVRATEAGELILTHRVDIAAPREEVWRAYTTGAGWQRWAAPVAEVDLRVGGSIRTHYEPTAEIGAPGTNTLEIVNYVPHEVLTLRAEVAPNWPDVLAEDADKLSNVILFDELGPDRTRVRSYGIGYRDTPELRRLLVFFEDANSDLMERLKEVLEAD